ncbi:MAG: hypothetical protein IAG10_22770 [Planctomycetaceae bacterium]|nr:hypothetical protein [Planctomycetaceae bacterium]
MQATRSRQIGQRRGAKRGGTVFQNGRIAQDEKEKGAEKVAVEGEVADATVAVGDFRHIAGRVVDP